jgi:hypothetical protein
VACAEDSQLACIGAILGTIDRNTSNVLAIDGRPIREISDTYLRNIVSYVLIVGHHADGCVIIRGDLFVVPKIVGINLEELSLTGDDSDGASA